MNEYWNSILFSLFYINTIDQQLSTDTIHTILLIITNHHKSGPKIPETLHGYSQNQWFFGAVILLQQTICNVTTEIQKTLTNLENNHQHYM